MVVQNGSNLHKSMCAIATALVIAISSLLLLHVLHGGLGHLLASLEMCDTYKYAKHGRVLFPFKVVIRHYQHSPVNVCVTFPNGT